ncbi:glycosyltransferase family 41 protein [Polaromonas sp. JS666]|uniref:tetratricopeptide repeat protein n=1 Tax=Polaromonas sp. (strain JS666 / ATCC BAA-500) TaxID=296591 RepID=UPI00088387F3|nr:glycosyltransferase family 41 protein [Polaromonas sp. JS666]SDN80224.1 Predicted O-linked N-acetylglucosamine transferase, SPINDLY family [Polaromonas sp. JS666]
MGIFDRIMKGGRTTAGDAGEFLKPSGPGAEQLLEDGMKLEQQGRPEEALLCYDTAVKLMPELARAHFNRGTILLDRGDAQQALEAFTQAVRYKPESAGAHFNLGAAYTRLDQHEAAVSAYREALALKPGFAEAEMALGAAFEELGQDEAAVASYRRALEIDPVYTEVHDKLVKVLSRSERFDEVAETYRQMLETDPHNAGWLNNLGAVQRKLGRFKDSAASFRQAVAVDPEDALAHNNLGATLRTLGQLTQAVDSYRQALEIRPDFIEAHHNLGNLLADLGQADSAVESYRQALEINPDFAESLTAMGAVFQTQGQFDEAVECHRRALAIKPDYAQAHSNLGNTLQDIGQLESSLESTRRALELQPDFTDAHNSLLFVHNYLADQPVANLLAEARRFGDVLARRARPAMAWANPPDPDRRLRIGLVSGDFCIHPVGYFLDAVMAALASSATSLELFGYPTRSCDDELSQRLKACCHAWHPVVGLSDEHVAELIREDGIDILIDLSGHTAYNRLPVFAWKPAPVQLSWLGYFATTGVQTMDYLLADPWTMPDSEEGSFTEKIWRLPETRLCFTPPRADVTVSPLPALSNGYVTFGCFNNLTKMNDAVVALWAQVLNAVPASRLFLKARQLQQASAQREVLARFAAHGIEPGRLILEDYVPRENYLAAYQRVDIALDPFPYPGGTTTVEALWMGVPVLTLAGERFLSRQGVGLMMNAGLPEWVASNPGDYLSRAVAHAGDLQKLSALRAGLRSQVLASPIFDAPRFARHFETALRGMWHAWCAENTAPAATHGRVAGDERA